MLDHVTEPGTLITVTAIKAPSILQGHLIFSSLPKAAHLPGRPFLTISFSPPFLLVRDLTDGSTHVLDTRWHSFAIVTQEYADAYVSSPPPHHTGYLEEEERPATPSTPPPPPTKGPWSNPPSSDFLDDDDFFNDSNPPI